MQAKRALRAIIAWATVMATCFAVTACNREPGEAASGMPISNEQVRNHAFLQCMYKDEYFPKHLVDKGKQILVRLSAKIEKKKPADENALYALTHAATDEFNQLDKEFGEADGEIETVARECIASDFDFIAKAYGFVDADIEKLVGTREW